MSNGVPISESVRVTALHSPIDPSDRWAGEIPHRPGLRVNDLRPDTLPDVRGLDVATSVNGRVLTAFEAECYAVQPGDSVLFKVVPHGDDGGGKVLGAVASIALMVAAPHVAGPLTGSISGLVGGLSETAGAFVFQGLSAAIGLGGAMVINSVLPPARPDMGNVPSLGSSGFDESPTYSWSIEENPTRNGHPVAIPYGHCRNVTPFLLTRYVSTDGDKQYLNCLYLLGEGPIDDVDGVSNIKINGNPIENYEGVQTEIRRGTGDQAVIPWFNDAINERSVSVKLSAGDWATFTTDGTALQSLGVGLSAPGGLWYANDAGGLNEIAVQVELQYRAVGALDWTWWDTVTLSDASRSPKRQYQRIDGLSADRYEVRARFASQPDTGPRYSTDVWFEYLHEIVPDDFAFPHSALLGVRALATDQLSGSRPRLTCDVKRSTVDVWDPAAEAWTTQAASNMGWMAYDLARHPRYGGGVKLSCIIHRDFANAAEWCDVKGLAGSLYIDSKMDLQTAWDHCGLFGRFRVVQRGTQVGTIVDRPADMPEQGFVATAANIIKGSFGVDYLESSDRADAVQVTWMHPEKGRDTVLVMGEHYRTITDRQPNVAQITLFPCNDLESAIAAGRYYLNCNKYLTRTVSLALSIDAISCQVGDVIQIANDRIGWGQSGRVVSATTGTVTLNRPVTLLPGTDYWITLTHRDKRDDVTGAAKKETVLLAPVGAETKSDTVALSTPWAHIPIEGCVCAICDADPAGREIRWYRVTDISRNTKHRRTVKALEYHPEVYEDAGNLPVIDDVGQLGAVSGLQAGTFDRTEDGVAKRLVSLFWRGNAIAWTVFVRRVGDPAWRVAGETREPQYDVRNLEVGHYYQMAVSASRNPADGQVVTVDYTHGTPTGLVETIEEYSTDALEIVTGLSGGAETVVQEVA
jgi:predicted phage tail protein